MPDVITSNSTKSVINRLWAEQMPTIRGTTRGGFSVGFGISRDHIPCSAGLCFTVAGSQTAWKPCTPAQDWSLGRPRSVALARQRRSHLIGNAALVMNAVTNERE